MRATLNAFLLVIVAFIGLVFCDNPIIDTTNQLVRHSRAAGGKPLNLGKFTPYGHNFSTGEAAIINEGQVLINKVWYDGLGPKAYWIISNSDKVTIERTHLLPEEYTIIADETGSCEIAKQYVEKNVLLTLPETFTFNEIKYIGMYCVMHHQIFGFVQIPQPISVPDFNGLPSVECQPKERKPHDIGIFTPFAHQLATGETTILNENQVLITNVTYDGLGPAAYWIVSNSDKVLKERPKLTAADYTIIPDETGSCGITKPYKGKDVMLTLPANLKFSKLKYISMYCVRYDHNFGYIRIPNRIRVPTFNDSAVEECSPFEKTTSAITIGIIAASVVAALGIIIGAIIVYFKCIRKK